MQKYIEEKLPMAKTEYWHDTTFSNEEKPIITNVLNSNNSNQIIETLKGKWFVDRDLNEEKSLERIQELYRSNDSNFKEIVDSSSANEETKTKLLGASYKKDKVISELKAEVGEKFKLITELETKLENDKIKKLLKEASDQKLINEKEIITKVEIGEWKERKTYEIQYIDGKLIGKDQEKESK
jgi:hypothetical protein